MVRRTEGDAGAGTSLSVAAVGVVGGLCLLLAVAAAAHDVYIGYGRAELDEREFSGQLAYNKLDILQALTQLRGAELHTLPPEEFHELVRRYLAAHFQVATAGDTLVLELMGQTQQADNVIFDFRFASDRPLAELRVRNDVLVELFPQQVNTLTVRGTAGHTRHVFHAERRVIDLSPAALRD